MEKKILGIFICTLLIATAIPALGTEINTSNCTMQQVLLTGVEWSLTYDRGEFDECRYIIQTMPDKGYLTCGVTEESDNYYVWLLKLDSDGNEEWLVVNYDLNGSYIDAYNMDVFSFHIIQTTDEGFLITGASMVSDEVQGELVWATAGYLWKIDASGSTEWVQHYYSVDELRLDFTYATIEIQDGYVSTGFSIYYNITGYVIDIDGFLMHTDFNGNLIWIQFYEATGEDFLTSLCKTSDGGYLCTGWIDSTEVADGALWMLKTDDTGEKQWEHIFDGPGFEYTYGKGCFETSDGGYIMAGNTGSYGAGAVDSWVIKTDGSGNEVWNQTFGFKYQDYTWCMDKTTDGTYAIVITKNIYSAGGTRDDIFVVEFNETGETEWSYLNEEAGIQRVTGIYHTDDHGFIVSGRTYEYGVSASDGIIYKIGAFPHLDIAISGGIGVKATITNNGFGDAIDVPYEIIITGGLLGMINKTISDTVDISSKATETTKSRLLFGFGPIQVTATVGPKMATDNLFQFLIITI